MQSKSGGGWAMRRGANEVITQANLLTGSSLSLPTFQLIKKQGLCQPCGMVAGT